MAYSLAALHPNRPARWGLVACAVGWALTAGGCQRLPDDDDGIGTAGIGGDGGTTGFGGSEGSTSPFLPGDSGADGSSPGDIDCNPVTQTGCSSNEKCTINRTGGVIDYGCVVDDEELEPLSPCDPSVSDGVDSCVAGTACIPSSTGGGLCMPLCLSSSDCQTGRCLPDPEEGIRYCATECSPFETSCESPLQCRREGGIFACKFPREDDDGTAGDPCLVEGDQGCGPGLACIAGSLLLGCESPSCCTNLCDLDGSASCTAPATCSPLLQSPEPGFESVGACFNPA